MSVIKIYIVKSNPFNLINKQKLMLIETTYNMVCNLQILKRNQLMPQFNFLHIYLLRFQSIFYCKHAKRYCYVNKSIKHTEKQEVK